MRRYLHCTLIICILVGFTACHKIPDHARYIPKDALLVVGLNTKSLGKKVAWQAIMGSKLFQQLQEHMTDKQAMNNLEKAGIDGMNTFYVYVKGDKRFKYGSKITALLPLSDVGQWESYVKNNFPKAVVKQQGDRKEASLNEGMYAGWNDKVLIVMNVLPNTATTTDTTVVYASGDSSVTTTHSAAAAPRIDDATLAEEMQAAFSTTNENALTNNSHFSKLEKDNHDVVFWMNYDELMSQYMSQNISGMTGGLSLSNNLWKGAAFAGGFDFEKGRIAGDIHYYTSDALKELSKEMGSTNADKDMLDRLPAANLDMLMAFHMSTKGTKAMLEKTGMAGLANMALSQQGLTLDYILDAFTGDMAFTLNDFAIKKQDGKVDSTGGASDYKPAFSMVYAMKINKEENFKKILAMFTQNGLLVLGNNTYAMPISATDSVIIMVDNKYVVAGNNKANVDAYLHGSHTQKLPEASKAYGHPFAMYADVQQMVKTVDPAWSHSAHDSATIVASKELITDIVFNGGDYKDDAFHYDMAINFSNKDENSILQLMDFAMKLSEAGKDNATAYNGQVMAN